MRRFENVDDAEKCIESLRKYRNLHPSFSKVGLAAAARRTCMLTCAQQVHKIPGTAYANVPSSARTAAAENPDSFKAKMERLADEGSTNLYIEGLAAFASFSSCSLLIIAKIAIEHRRTDSRRARRAESDQEQPFLPDKALAPAAHHRVRPARDAPGVRGYHRGPSWSHGPRLE
jgi:hypothetical protein